MSEVWKSCLNNKRWFSNLKAECYKIVCFFKRLNLWFWPIEFGPLQQTFHRFVPHRFFPSAPLAFRGAVKSSPPQIAVKSLLAENPNRWPSSSSLVAPSPTLMSVSGRIIAGLRLRSHHRQPSSPSPKSPNSWNTQVCLCLFILILMSLKWVKMVWFRFVWARFWFNFVCEGLILVQFCLFGINFGLVFLDQESVAFLDQESVAWGERERWIRP